MFMIFAWIFVGVLILGLAILIIELLYIFVVGPFLNIFRKNPIDYIGTRYPKAISNILKNL